MSQTESGKLKNFEGPANKHKIKEAKNPIIHISLLEIILEIECIFKDPTKKKKGQIIKNIPIYV